MKVFVANNHNGISPMKCDEVIGKIAMKYFGEDECIEL